MSAWGEAMPLAIHAIGEGVLGPGRAAVAAFTVGLLLTFLAVRINTRLIRANVSWWFHDIESGSGLHVHHMVFGVVLMVAVGLGLIAAVPQGLLLQALALLFGAGVALTLDEFALILHLQDVYWTREGRLSVDAVVVAVCIGVLLVLGVRPLGDLSTVNSGSVAGRVLGISGVIVIDLLCAVVCLLKGKLWTGLIAVFIPLIGFIGALRLARPSSPWARWRYGKKPAKLARAQYREDRINASWRARREVVFDVIAGKPHLPDVSSAATSRPAGPRRTGDEAAPEDGPTEPGQ